MPVRILSIDDDPAMNDLLAVLLKTYGFEVLTANTGADSIKLIHDTAPDVILLDLRKSEEDGWQQCKKVRKVSNVPILILSALDSPAMVASALDAGADDYLIKPVASNVLIAHLRKLTRRTAKLEKPPHPIHSAAVTS